MFAKLSQNRNKFGVRISALALSAIAFLANGAAVHADSPKCKKVKGHYTEHLVPPPTCTSPVGLCVAGEYEGDVRGEFFGSVISLTPPSPEGVSLFTTSSVIHARIDGKEGDLNIKNFGAFQAAENGNIVDLQYITSGTGQLSGATGVIRASGTFNIVAGTGESDYEGMVCLP